MDRGGELRGQGRGAAGSGCAVLLGACGVKALEAMAGVDAAVGERCLGGLAAPRLVGAERGAISGDELAESECSCFLHLTV